jgi:hypothetical protein
MKNKTDLEKTKNEILIEFIVEFEDFLLFLLEHKYNVIEMDECDLIIDKICQVYDYSSFIKRYCNNQEINTTLLTSVMWGIDDFDYFLSEWNFETQSFYEDFIHTSTSCL